MSQKACGTSAETKSPAAAAAEVVGLPDALRALMPTEEPHVRATRWDAQQGCPVFVNATRRGRPTIPEGMRDLFAEFGVPDVVREFEPLSRNTCLAIASDSPGVQAWSWILAGQKLAGAYRLQAVADARAAEVVAKTVKSAKGTSQP
jgi:hypothetical protein